MSECGAPWGEARALQRSAENFRAWRRQGRRGCGVKDGASSRRKIEAWDETRLLSGEAVFGSSSR
jgi:hypothetical protein